MLENSQKLRFGYQVIFEWPVLSGPLVFRYYTSDK